MQTKLSRICDAIIEAGWLAALIVTPLFFNTSSNRVFEPDKLHLLRSIALIMAVAWATQLLDTGLRGRADGSAAGSSRGRGLWDVIRGAPLVLPALALVGAYLISTALSVVPHVSFFGSYVRMQGTFTFISYALIFFMVLTHVRARAQVNRIFYTIILTSLPIAIYAIIQHYGLDPLPWGGDVRERVAANMGNAIFVAAYLIMALFLTLERLVDSVAALLNEEQGTTADALRAGAYLFILVVQLIAIIFTQSRGPWLGLGAGLYVFGLMGVLLLGRWAAHRSRGPRWLARVVRPVWAGIIGLTIAGIAFLVVFNLPNSPLSSLRGQRFIGRLGTLMNTTEGTNAVRALIWEGVVDMMLKPHAPIQQPDGTPDLWNPIRPLVGYGPESMWVAYNRFYPPDLAHYEARNASPDRSHNETFDALVRTGLLGFGIQLWLYGSIFYYALRWLGLMEGRRQRNLFLGLLTCGAALGVLVPVLADGSLRLAGIGLPAGLIIGLIVYVTVDLLLKPADNPSATDVSLGAPQSAAGDARRQLLILALLAAIIAHFVEIHFGIAIAATLTTFWTLAGVLVAVGLGWVERAEPAAPGLTTVAGPAAVRKVEAALFKGKLIVIYGPRQVGKTTLVKEILSRYPDDSLYLNCDEPDVRAALTEQTSTALRAMVGSHRLVVIDEAQRVRNIGLTLKLLVDNYPDIQVVATGSSSFELSNLIVEPLTGRKVEFRLFPLSVGELLAEEGPLESRRLLERRLRYGMYPEVITNDDPASIILEVANSYLFRDVLEYQTVKGPDVLRRLLQALALQAGGEVSFNELASLLGVDKATIDRYSIAL